MKGNVLIMQGKVIIIQGKVLIMQGKVLIIERFLVTHTHNTLILQEEDSFSNINGRGEESQVGTVVESLEGAGSVLYRVLEN